MGEIRQAVGERSCHQDTIGPLNRVYACWTAYQTDSAFSFLKTLPAFARKEKDISDADKANIVILNLLYIEETQFVAD